ncbi:MAG: tail tape measure protein [Alphaproteobacteria bacterium]|nr:tail tape measure protein [Alphaproteobacteria bacterium]MDE2339989.1 tail tape measure protein [Alphaproteobacteria bacterium]
MNQVIDSLVVQVRGDTQTFASDVANMRAQLDGPLGASIDAAGNRIETSLAHAIATGNLSFKSLEATALAALANIATTAVKLGLDSIFGGSGNGLGGSSAGGGLLTGLTSLIGGLFGSPGRATGGPVSPGQPYMVGENGPELFVPTSAGNIATGGQLSASTARALNVSINVNAPAGSAPDLLGASSRQVARAVRQALLQDN